MEEKQKRKRKISLITVFLWVLTVVVMIVITLSGIKKKSALEIIDNNWNIGLSMYDRTSDIPNQAITDFTWNATSSNEKKQLVMQINYNCTTGKQYQPGEIVIEIPGIPRENFKERTIMITSPSYRVESTVSADKSSDTIKNYDWSYTYDFDNDMYIFTNNKVMAEDEYFEGTIQILYDLETIFKIKTDLEFKAKIKENIEGAEELIVMESNVCSFHYTSQKRTYEIENKISNASKSIYQDLEAVINDYYWVLCKYEVSKNNAPIMALGQNANLVSAENSQCIREQLEEGCVLYDNEFNKIEAKENNTYYYLPYGDYYIGYPKNKYKEGDKIENKVELWGRYEDEEQMQKLSEDTKSISLVDFDFEYTGKLYNITKFCDIKYINKNNIKSTRGCNIDWNIDAKAFYTDSVMDVEICDDLLYMTREDGSISKLSEDEYNFKNIEIPVFYTYNKLTGNAGDKLIGYNYEVQVRNKGNEDYVVVDRDTTSSSPITISFRSDVVGVKIIIKDLDKTLYPSLKDKISVEVNIHTNDCAEGYVYNFSYLQVYGKDSNGNRKILNEVDENNYGTESTELKVKEYDITTYGRYMQRDYSLALIQNGHFKLSNCKKNGELINNIRKEKYETEYKISNILEIDNFTVDRDCIIKQYDILPAGVKLVSSKEDIINQIYSGDRWSSLSYSKLKLKNGTKFKALDELINYIKENTEVEIDYNYKNSGRTKISVIYNLNEIDWSYYSKNESGKMSLGTKLKVEISYDSILEYGTSYKNYAYSLWNDQEYEYNSYYDYTYDYGITSDKGYLDPLGIDIDNDGDIEEDLSYSPSILNINHVTASKQAVKKEVKTDLTKGDFISRTADVTAGSEYTYKLKVITGANSLKDLIIYDNLETILDSDGDDIGSGWKGEFLGVDTSYALSKGYAPKVYYSEEINPGKLTDVPDKWIELTDTINKSKVKSICVDLRYKEDGSEMELSSNNIVYVLINMQAPLDDTIISSSKNMFSTNWRAKDPMGTVIENVDGIYSNQINVRIYKKENERKDIKGIKTWENDWGYESYRPKNVTVKLLQDGIEYMRSEVSEDDDWEYEFLDVPIYKNDKLEEYEYSVEEVEVPMYEAIYDGYNITNKLKTTDIEIEKIWDDNDNEKGLRPIHFIIRIYDGEKLVYDGWLDGCYEWFGLKKTISLPMYRPDGSEIEYRIDEEVPKNLDFYVSGEYITDPNFNTEDGLEQYNKHYVKKIDGYTVTNKYIDKEEKIKITGKKVWEDDENKALKRPDSVILQIKAGEEVVSEAVVSESTNWSCEFEVLKYDEVGNEINYYIDERTTPKFYEKELTNETTVTNKFVVSDEKVKIEVIKIWEDLENKYKKRPKNITLQVLNGENVVEEKKVNEKDNWKVEFELLKYDELGNEIEYTVNEKEEVKHYEKRISGYTVINKCIYEPGEKPSLPSTSDINIFIYVAISFVAIVGTIALILVLKKNKK